MKTFEKQLKLEIQSNSVITNSTGPRKSVRYSREDLCSKPVIWDLKTGFKFVRYNRDFVVTVIVITEFDCTSFVSVCFEGNKMW